MGGFVSWCLCWSPLLALVSAAHQKMRLTLPILAQDTLAQDIVILFVSAQCSAHFFFEGLRIFKCEQRVIFRKSICFFFLIRRGIGFMNDLWNSQRQTQMEKHNCFHQLLIVFRDFFLFSKTNRPLIQRSSWHAIWEMSSTPLQYNTCLTCSFCFFHCFWSIHYCPSVAVPTVLWLMLLQETSVGLTYHTAAMP